MNCQAGSFLDYESDHICVPTCGVKTAVSNTVEPILTSVLYGRVWAQVAFAPEDAVFSTH